MFKNIKTAEQIAQEKAQQESAKLPAIRKRKEAEGVVINGIRYAGDSGNRQALKEAIDLAAELNITTFPSWKDSDGNFHANHSSADVKAALLAIASRRGELIALEGQYTAGVLDGTITDVELLTWTT